MRLKSPRCSEPVQYLMEHKKCVKVSFLINFSFLAIFLLLGSRLVVGHGTLDPRAKVRILPPQPLSFFQFSHQTLYFLAASNLELEKA